MTKRCVTGAVLVALVLAGVAFAADVTGKWRADFQAPNGEKAQNVFTFKVDGENVSGTVYSSLAGNEVPIEDGQTKGDQISFAITRDFGGGPVKIRYSGKVAGDEIKIVATAGEGAEGFRIEMTAKREKP